MNQDERFARMMTDIAGIVTRLQPARLTLSTPGFEEARPYEAVSHHFQELSKDFDVIVERSS